MFELILKENVSFESRKLGYIFMYKNIPNLIITNCYKYYESTFKKNAINKIVFNQQFDRLSLFHNYILI